MSTKNQNSKQLQDLFSANLKVPAYQRAFAWEEPQLQQFVADMLEIAAAQNRQYYFGHFIVETDNKNECLWIIDGQQRLTTFVLFLMICNLYRKDEALKADFIDKFATVDYDQELFLKIQSRLSLSIADWTIESLELNHLENQTLSLGAHSICAQLFPQAIFRQGRNGIKSC